MKKTFLMFMVFCTSVLTSWAKVGDWNPDPMKDKTSVNITPRAYDGYTLKWSDQFGGSALDETRWNIEVNGDGGGNGELQYYVRDGVSVRNGNLVLTATRKDYGGKPFTSGRVNTQSKVFFKYGKVEARIKFPKTYRGLWPAFWMMGNDIYSGSSWPACGELDIVEMGNIGGWTGEMFDALGNPVTPQEKSERFLNGATHWGTTSDTGAAHPNYGHSETLPFSVQDGNYHLFSCEWDENDMICYVDGFEYYHMGNLDTNHFKKPHFILFNLAVGGGFPQIYNANDISAIAPGNGSSSEMLVDYVAVYQKDGDTTCNFTEDPHAPEFGQASADAHDFSADKYYVIELDDNTYADKLNGKEVVDWRVNDNTRFLYIWEQCMEANPADGTANIYGQPNGFINFKKLKDGYAAAYFVSHPNDFSGITREYKLHIDFKSNEVRNLTVGIMGTTKYKVGNAFDADMKVDFSDGKWHSIDIPLSATGVSFGSVTDYSGNTIVIETDATPGQSFQFGGIYYYGPADNGGNSLYPRSKIVNLNDMTELILKDKNGNSIVADDWTVTPSYIGYVNGNKFVADAPGAAMITATVGGKTVTTNVDVITTASAGMNDTPHDFSGSNYLIVDLGDTTYESITAPKTDWRPNDDTRNFFIWNADWLGAGHPLFDVNESTGKNIYGVDGEYKNLKPLYDWGGMAYSVEHLDASALDTDYILHLDINAAGKEKVGITVKGVKVEVEVPGDNAWHGVEIPILAFINKGLSFAGADDYSGNIVVVERNGDVGSSFKLGGVYFYKKTMIPTADAPTVPAANVRSFYSDMYDSPAVSFANWVWDNHATAAQQVKLTPTDKAFYVTDMSEAAGFSGSVDASGMDNLHIDIYANADNTNVAFSPVTGAGIFAIQSKTLSKGWNSFDIPLSDFVPEEGNMEWSAVYQFAFYNGTGENFYVDNIYFYSNAPVADDKTAPVITTTEPAVTENSIEFSVKAVDASAPITITVMEGEEVIKTFTGLRSGVSQKVTIEGLAANSSHTYTIKATDSATPANTATATVTAKTNAADETAPVVVLGAPAVTTTSVTFNVTATDESAPITITVMNGEEVKATKTVASGAETAITIDGLAPSTQYSFTVTAQDNSAKKNVSEAQTVTATTATPVAVTGVTLDKTTAELTVGEGTVTLAATVAPADAANKTVTWTSSDETVATVADGVVTPVAAGEATITVTTQDGTKTAVCVVTVKAAPVNVVQPHVLTNGNHEIKVYPIDNGDGTYTLTIKSEETMNGMGGSFWHVSGAGADMRNTLEVKDGGKTMVITVESSTQPQPYTPLYILMPGEVNFGSVELNWQKGQISEDEPTDPTDPTEPEAIVVPVPNRAAADVTAVYTSGTYANDKTLTVPGWAAGNATLADYTDEAGRKAIHATNAKFIGYNFDAVDVSERSHLHVDVYPVNVETISVGVTDNGDHNHTFNVTKGQWNSLDYVLADNNVKAMSINEMKICKNQEGQWGTNYDGTAEFYLANIYFYKPADVVPSVYNKAIATTTSEDPKVTVNHEHNKDMAFTWTTLENGNVAITVSPVGAATSANFRGKGMNGQFTLNGTVEAFNEYFDRGKTDDTTYTLTLKNPANRPADGASIVFNGQIECATTGSNNDWSDFSFTQFKYGMVATGEGEIVAVESVALSKTAAEVKAGKTLKLIANINPEYATNQNVTWSSSNEDVATVENGVVTVKAGAAVGATATITVTTEDGGKTASCVITVADNTLPETGADWFDSVAGVDNGLTYDIDYAITYNDDQTITVEVLSMSGTLFDEKNPQKQFNFAGEWPFIVDNKVTSPNTFNVGDKPEMFFWFPYAGGVARVDVKYTVGGKKVPDVTAPVDFTATVASVSDNYISIEMKAKDEASEKINYTITLGDGTTYNVSGNNNEITRYNVENLASETQYTITVTAADGAGNLAANTETLTATTKSARGEGVVLDPLSSENYIVTGDIINLDGVVTISNVRLTKKNDSAKDTNNVNISIDKGIVGMTRNADGTFSYTVSGNSYIPGDKVTGFYYIVYDGGADRIDFSLTVPANAGWDKTGPQLVSVGVKEGAATPSSVTLEALATDENGTQVKYLVYQGENHIATLVGNSGETVSQRVGGLIENTTYNFKVVAMDVVGNLSADEKYVSATTGSFHLVWSDEFDSNTLGKNWNVEVNGDGGGNWEQQYYTARPENVNIVDGNLVLTAIREKYGMPDDKEPHNYTSGRVNSKHNVTFTHGKIEARIKMDKTKQGLWPAFWMMGDDIDQVGWPKCGETDIMEAGHQNGFGGNEETYFSGCIHWGEAWDAHGYWSGDIYNPYSIMDGEYHVYTCIWEDEWLKMYLDDQKEPYYNAAISKTIDPNIVSADYLHKPNFIIFNLAVGGQFPGLYDEEEITALPEPGSKASMWVDYVRVYQGETNVALAAGAENDMAKVTDNVAPADFVLTDKAPAIVATATDNSNNTISYTVLNGRKTVGFGAAKSGESATINIKGLVVGQSYTLTVVASDVFGNTVEKDIRITVPGTVDPTEAAPGTSKNATDVVALYSDKYDNVANVSTYNSTWWNWPVLTETNINGDNYMKYSENMGGVIGWEYEAINPATAKYMHIDIWPSATGNITIAPIASFSEKETYAGDMTLAVTGGKWNSFDIAIADIVAENKDFRLDGLNQFSISGYGAQSQFCIDNVFFFNSDDADDDLATGISVNAANNANAKVFGMNGQQYNSNAKLAKGIYVVNGKKVVK